MKKLIIFFWLSFIFLTPVLLTQDVEQFGLKAKHLTSLKIGEGIIAVGTNSNGVFWQNLYSITDTGWKQIELSGVNVQTVYPHKSGPIGWAIGMGAKPNLNNSEFIFCSFMGQAARKMSYGIDTNNTEEITEIDGFPDPTICGETFAIGGRLLYRRYFNDTTWQPIYNLTIEGNFASLKAREENAYVYAGGGEGFAGMLLIRSSDKGNSWESLSPMCYVTDLDFYGDSIHKIIVTDRLKIVRSMDSGLNWSTVFSSDSIRFQKISFSCDGKFIYAIANSNFYNLPRTFLFSSSDDGNTWKIDQLPIYDIVVGMDLDYENSIYLATISDGVFKLKSPIVNVEDYSRSDLPTSFQLNQNYPNPFNPETVISWQLPTDSYVTLKLFDVLGNEVATLVNDEQKAGLHKYKLVSAIAGKNYQLTSGVYFYQLRADNLIQNKKMILLK